MSEGRRYKTAPHLFPIQKILFKIHQNNNPCFFQFLKKEFLENYLGRWEQQVSETPGLTKEEKSRLLLSKQTILGWKITSNIYFFRYTRGEG